MNSQIEAARIVLRPVRSEDVDGPYLTWMNDPEVTRYLESRFTRYTRDDLARYVDDVLQQSGVYFFAIVLKDGDRHIGNIKLGPVSDEHARGDVGIIIGEKDCWGRGYATEAIEALSAWAFADLGLAKITAGAYSVNEGSVRAFRRAGFDVEATVKDHYRSEGRAVDGILMARFPDGGA
ncbi:MAG: GNAT family N-acetyltransferase [Acidimicrobiia bacterium]|nr:GNAT family N-acetyltransferase [Acidimicrobiia bacterium]